MKTKKIILKILIIAMMATFLIKAIPSFAVMKTESVDLKLDYFRYINGEKRYGYALNTVSGEDQSNHPIFQISTEDHSKTYYCLNATSGEHWNNSTVGSSTTYNRSYDLETDLGQLAKETRKEYVDIANSKYINQILWILENVYTPDKNPDQNSTKKKAFLARAGIVYGDVDDGDLISGTKKQGYKYVPVAGYDYTDKLADGTQAKKGWFYYKDNDDDDDDEYTVVELPDEMIEVAIQSALWYYTNYLDHNTDNTQTYNVKEQGLQLRTSNGSDDTTTSEWPALESEACKVETSVSGVKANVGAWKQDQATILCEYLIDAANNYATTTPSIGVPLEMEKTTTVLASVSLSSKDYYLVGPMKINEKRPATYTLEGMKINGQSVSEAYISNANGEKETDQTLSNYIGKDFFVAIPKDDSSITDGNIVITFEGKYTKNEKKLWVSTTAGEQPVAEVTPKDENFTLTVTPQEKQFDLALRKAIVKLTDADGVEKSILNEEGLPATRNVECDTSSIPGTGTGTYNHRKDPVVVRIGDKVTYEITVFNEGEMDGYAKTIVDRLPASLTVKPATGTYSSGGVEYTYVYDDTTHTITFTNVSKNVLKAYDGTTDISSESIQIECEVIGTKVENNKYLTNIAYIAEEYNNETGTEVKQDRDSSTQNSPSGDNLETTGDKYDGYHGGDNKNGESNKDVYNDGTNNDDYFPGKEDDDDFEILTVEPAEFDLALQKYISSINSKGKTKAGRKAPTIDTTDLANGKNTTAKYTQDKSLVNVKHGDYITYTFTVYNEGDIAGYVNKITDNIPKGLQFVYLKEPNDGTTLIACDSDGNTQELTVTDDIYELVEKNNIYWSLDENEGGLLKDTYNNEKDISITCDVEKYLGGTNKLLEAYDSTKDVNKDGENGLDRLSVTVVLRVLAEDGSGLVIRNEAAITEATKSDGTKQDIEDLIDRDSQINRWEGKDIDEDGNKKYQDDEDYDNVYLGIVDLALTKFITAVSDDIVMEDGEFLTQDKTSVNAGSESNPYTRATKVDSTNLRDDPECHDATYHMVKDALLVPENSYVLYNIRVYNEGEVDVYAAEVTDYLPEYLDYVDCDFNKEYKWTVAADGKTITTTYLSAENGEQNLLKAFNKTTDDGAGSGLDYRDLPILCRINSKTPSKTRLVNTAAITKYEDDDGNEIDSDVDSVPDQIEDKNEEKRNQDDDDYEVVEVQRKKVDLALKKFIAAVSEDTNIVNGEYLTQNGNVGSKENPYTRANRVDTTELRDNPECHDATYYTVKDPLLVAAKSYVLYDIRVFNEGEVDVYAGEVTDHLPDYLDFVECEFNNNYGWTVGADGKTITTNYLSAENGEQNLLKAFNKTTDDGAGSGLDYRDLQVLCRLNDDAPTNTNIVNVAEITEYEDKDGEEIPKDEDSTPDNVDTNKEDDDDFEQIVIKTFDLSLLKYVSTVYVTEDGKTTVTQTGNTGNDNTDIIPKVEIHRKKMNSTVVKFGYTIKVTNEGDVEGYAKEITDYVPSGLKFYAEDNKGWTDEGNNVISTRLLENTLLKPGESAEVTVIFRWINGGDNLGEKTNVAEISEDYNKEGIPDKDSTPDNQKEKEDDIDDATVLLSVSTGLIYNFVKYATISVVILAVFGIGLFAIKKFVL